MKSNRLLFPVAAALVMNACGTKTHAENNSESVVLKKICSFVCVCAYFLVTLRAFYIAPYYDRIY